MFILMSLPRRSEFVYQWPSSYHLVTCLFHLIYSTAKVGYFLDQRPPHLSADQKYIKKLLSHIPKQPHYMNRNHRKDGKYIEKWQLIVPLEIINRTWEEPDAENIRY